MNEDGQPGIIAGFCYMQMGNDEYLIESIRESNRLFAYTGLRHIVLLPQKKQASIIGKWQKDVSRQSELEASFSEIRVVLWMENVWTILSLHKESADYLAVIAADHRYVVSNRTYRLPTPSGGEESFPFSGPNFRILVPRRYAHMPSRAL